jgi:hypothetical protein
MIRVFDIDEGTSGCGAFVNFLKINKDLLRKYVGRIDFGKKVHESKSISFFHDYLHDKNVSFEMTNYSHASYTINIDAVSCMITGRQVSLWDML